MNQEEFDKRLSESFKNEHLPPDHKLWQNISSRLDEKKKGSLWYWLFPVVLVVAAFGGWLMSGINNGKTVVATSTVQSSTNTTSIGKEEVKLTETTTNTSATENTDIAATSDNTAVAADNAAVANDNTANESSAAKNDATGKARKDQTIAKNDKTITGQDNTETEQPVTNSGNNANTSQDKPKNKGVFLTSYTETSIPSTHSRDIYSTLLRMHGLIRPPVVAIPELPKEEPLAEYETPFKNRLVYRSPYSKNPVNFNSKWWWSAGLGPQITFNKAIIPADSEAWVHRELWANRKKMTNNGSGFQSQLLLGHSLGKHFSFEVGLQYSRHTEDINFSLSSYQIEHRDSNNKIDAYLYVKLYIANGLDTTFYDATRGFQLAIKNRYNIFTIPVKFNFEQNISDRTKFVMGIGAGLTAITTKSATHLNLINDRQTIDKKTYQFMASFNAQFGFYTNFNDIGQLGVYSGFQMYSKPWELANKQYSIKMSDLQLGISFRRPLNW